MEPKTNIFITIDLECRRNSPDFTAAIYGRLRGQKHSFGLDFILSTFKRYQLAATFFVEPFFSYKFGKAALEDICSRILLENHDIQLHLHPFFKSSPEHTLEDKLHAYPLEQQIDLIKEGRDILYACGVKEIKAFRAGAFAANNTTYEALAAAGIKISSNYNLDYLSKACRISLPGQFNDFFWHKDKILEMPVTCFREFDFKKFKPSFKHLQITAMSYEQMKYIFEHAPRLNLKNIVILFHTFEFIHFIDEKNDIGKINPINISRFIRLCEFLYNHQSKFNVQRISDVDLNLKAPCAVANDVIPRMPWLLSVQGKLEQVRKRFPQRTEY